MAFRVTQTAGKLVRHLGCRTLGVEAAPGTEDAGTGGKLAGCIGLIGKIEESLEKLCGAFAVHLLPTGSYRPPTRDSTVHESLK